MDKLLWGLGGAVLGIAASEGVRAILRSENEHIKSAVVTCQEGVTGCQKAVLGLFGDEEEKGTKVEAKAETPESPSAAEIVQEVPEDQDATQDVIQHFENEEFNEAYAH